jgi:hypothetical protein
LTVFAKYWEPGQVKTRLSRSIGEAAAAELQQTFLRSLLSRFSAAADRLSLLAWPPSRQAEFRRIAPDGWDIAAQAAGDLGTKLSTCFQTQLTDVPQRLVAIGADSPDLPADFVTQAFDLLENYRVVLGPATDGGYYLIGMSQFVPLFDQIEWGTPRVWAQTSARLRDERIEFACLPPWSDVDHWDDLIALRERLTSSPEPALRELSSAIQEVLAAASS